MFQTITKLGLVSLLPDCDLCTMHLVCNVVSAGCRDEGTVQRGGHLPSWGRYDLH